MSRCDSEGATHHTGCECHEARRDAEIERLKAEVTRLNRELQSHDCTHLDTPGLIHCPIDKPCSLHRIEQLRDAIGGALTNGHMNALCWAKNDECVGRCRVLREALKGSP